MMGRLTRIVRARGGRPFTFLAGVSGLVAGLAFVAFGAYSLLDDESRANERPLVDINEVAAFNAPLSTVSPEAPAVTATPIVPPLADSAYRMIIDKLGVNAPVRTYGLDEKSVPIVPTGSDAAEVVAWYDFSARPGTGNNAVFAGHVTWYGEAVFFELTTLAAGDVVRLRGDDGTELIYNVASVVSIDPEDPDSVKVMYPTDPPSDVITIITCDGAFQQTDDPVFGGEYSRRLIVRAALATVTGAGSGMETEG